MADKYVEKIDCSGFDGLWEIDMTRSVVLDEKRNVWIPEWLAGQTIEIHHDGAYQNYEGNVHITDGLDVIMGYTAKFSDDEWVGYVARRIEGDPNHPLIKSGDLLKSGINLGEPIAWVKQVYVSPTTHYRISLNMDGTPQYMMERSLIDDGKTILSTVMKPEGTVIIRKYFTLLHR